MRQFLDRMDKPRVEEIRGIPPAIAIEQANPVKSSRSTVGTMTEINDYLKLLWPRLLSLFVRCGREIRPETAESIAEQILSSIVSLLKRYTFSITFWVGVPSKTVPRGFFDFLQRREPARLVDNKVVRVDARIQRSNGSAPVCRSFRIGSMISGENRARLIEAIETALRFAKASST